MAKALVGGVALALAVGDGRMTLEDRHLFVRPAHRRNHQTLKVVTQ
jgi:hypothetical protein